MSSANPAAYQFSRLHEKLSAILTISQQMNSERDLGALLDLVAREATRLLDADRASIFLLDREKLELWSKVALGSDEILRFDAGHGSLVVDEQIRQIEIQIAFAARNMGTQEPIS